MDEMTHDTIQSFLLWAAAILMSAVVWCVP